MKYIRLLKKAEKYENFVKKAEPVTTAAAIQSIGTKVMMGLFILGFASAMYNKATASKDIAESLTKINEQLDKVLSNNRDALQKAEKLEIFEKLSKNIKELMSLRQYITFTTENVGKATEDSYSKQFLDNLKKYQLIGSEVIEDTQTIKNILEKIQQGVEDWAASIIGHLSGSFDWRSTSKMTQELDKFNAFFSGESKQIKEMVDKAEQFMQKNESLNKSTKDIIFEYIEENGIVLDTDELYKVVKNLSENNPQVNQKQITNNTSAEIPSSTMTIQPKQEVNSEIKMKNDIKFLTEDNIPEGYNLY